MKLICCEVCRIVGVVSIAMETGFSVDRVNRYLAKRGVKSSGNTGYNNCNVYPSSLVQEAFNDVDGVLESEV